MTYEVNPLMPIITLLSNSQVPEKNPCSDPANAGKTVAVDCCELFKRTDPELIGTDDPTNPIQCDNCEECSGCRETCAPPLTAADNMAFARACQGRTVGEKVVFVQPSSQKKIVRNCPAPRSPRRRVPKRVHNAFGAQKYQATHRLSYRPRTRGEIGKTTDFVRRNIADMQKSFE